MITKVVTNTFDFGEVAAQLVPLHSRGVDGQWMRKHASAGVFNEFIENLKPEKGKSVIHVIALGDEEIYGPNRNCDGFSREDNVTAHTSFKDIGHVFKNHKNDDPFKAVGDVIQTAHNANMSRVQLLLSLDNRKCEKEVQALDNGKDVPVSMGSMQDFDVCSVCGHKAPTAEDHCHHIKYMLGQLLDNGQKVYMKNPKPKYFDISLVLKPADRIAYTLKKIAGTGAGVIGGHDLADIYGLRPVCDPKYATLRVLAAMQKQIPTVLRKITDPEPLAESTKIELKKQAKIHGFGQLVAFLNSNGWMMGPEDFGEVIGHGDPHGCGQAVDDFPVMDELLNDHTEVKALKPPAFIDQIPMSHHAKEDLEKNTSMSPEATGSRVMRITIAAPAKIATTTLDESEARGFASLYGHYKLAFAARHQDNQAVLRSVATTF